MSIARPAATGTLKAGLHWREAAAIYRDKLNRPLDAAKCLAEGGVLTEAIEIYIEFHDFEPAGDLYMKLDDREPRPGIRGHARPLRFRTDRNPRPPREAHRFAIAIAFASGVVHVYKV